jgi:hypothetical protein
MSLSFLLLVALAPEPSVKVTPAADATKVEVVAVLPPALFAAVPRRALTQDDGETWLRLCLVDDETREEGPPIFGTYRLDESRLLFQPRRPLAHGQVYRAILLLGDGKRVQTDYRVPARPSTPPAVVEKIYPTSDVLPANHLKFYLHFSRSMRESRDIFDRLQLLDEKGKPVPEPWRRTELWNRDCTRLTLWIHPGRIKMGIGPREGEGPVLEPDNKYTLVVGKDIVDADGQPLGKDFLKPFRAGADDRTRPLPAEWKRNVPKKGTREPLRIDFPEPLDRALLDRHLVVKDEDDETVTGTIEVGKDEKTWSFVPARPWTGGEHQLLVDEGLEDLAGNTPVRLFDVNLQEPASKAPVLTLRFKPLPQ